MNNVSAQERIGDRLHVWLMWQPPHYMGHMKLNVQYHVIILLRKLSIFEICEILWNYGWNYNNQQNMKDIGNAVTDLWDVS